MKGGGLVIVLFIIVFIFLFVSVIWGISAIVGGISSAFTSRRSAPERWPQASQSVLARTQEPAPPTPAPPPPVVTEKATAPEKNERDSMGHALEQLERTSKLRKEDALTEEEFEQIKAKLIQKIRLS